MNFHEDFRLMERIRELEIENRKLRAELDVKPLGAAVIDKLRRENDDLMEELDIERQKRRNAEKLYMKAMQHVPGPAYVRGLEPRTEMTSYAQISGEMSELRKAIGEMTAVELREIERAAPSGQGVVLAARLRKAFR